MRIAVILYFLLFIIACDAERVYEENHEFDNKIWYVDSIPVFQFDIKNAGKGYDIYMNLRNTLSYPFQNIYITYTLEDTLGQVIREELVNQQLFHDKTGKPLGDGGIGDIYDHRFLFLNDHQFSGEGTYRVRLQQYMRRDSLPEIIAVGIRVEENNIAN